MRYVFAKVKTWSPRLLDHIKLSAYSMPGMYNAQCRWNHCNHMTLASFHNNRTKILNNKYRSIIPICHEWIKYLPNMQLWLSYTNNWSLHSWYILLVGMWITPLLKLILVDTKLRWDNITLLPHLELVEVLNTINWLKCFNVHRKCY